MYKNDFKDYKDRNFLLEDGSLNMRGIYKNYSSKIEEQASEFKDISDLAKNLELEALNSTLDKLQLVISIENKVGATTENITDKFVVDNLKELVKKNKQGLYEIIFDTSKVLMIGSMSSVTNSSTVITAYSLNYNKNRVYREAFRACQKHYNCS